ncbi:hypothetical protein SSABA_v1c02790 [Spiroplasma sabaudiense Ar-1343]|uniref:Uncharacterized protein n=2 Tax=Spiroplasma sabaudiense TaxID=216944 RepID=W6A9Q2_9MOLU|nr:hypothetical protein SSABA_v1c02790 [Spiroplasma sabaudiense Ar-1343]
MPYIPAEIESKILEIQKKVALNFNKNKESTNSWNLVKIVDALNSDNTNYQLDAINALKDFNARMILNDVKVFLLSDLSCDENKILMIFTLASQQINDEFTVKKNNGIFKIDLKKNDFQGPIVKLKQLREELIDLIYNDNPSLFGVCDYILNSYFYSTFPMTIEEANNDLIAAIWYKGALAQGIDLGIDFLLSKINFSKSNFEKICQKITNYKII